MVGLQVMDIRATGDVIDRHPLFTRLQSYKTTKKVGKVRGLGSEGRPELIKPLFLRLYVIRCNQGNVGEGESKENYNL